MFRVLAAATLVIAAISPAMAQPSATLLAADSGRSYSGAQVQTRQPAQQPSATTTAPTPTQTRTNSTVDAVGNAAKATSDLIGIFGK